MTQVFIIILNFNGGKEIIECLDSLMNSDVSRIDLNIIVVDNGSADGSVEKIKELMSVRAKRSKFPPPPRRPIRPAQDHLAGVFKLIENEKNLGFSAGMNVGIRYALENGADAVLLLNQDVIVEKNFVKSLVKNKADIISPVLKFRRGGEWYYDLGGRINWWLGRPRHVEFSHIPSGWLANSPTSEEGFRPPRPPSADFRGVSLARIEYVSGCAMLVKRPVFGKIGLLDEKFFLYFEDIDFCLRARKAGFKIAVQPDCVVHHQLSEKKKKPLKQHFYHLKSNLIFINRYVPVYKKPVAYIYLVFLLFKVVWNQI